MGDMPRVIHASYDGSWYFTVRTNGKRSVFFPSYTLTETVVDKALVVGCTATAVICPARNATPKNGGNN